MADILAKRGHRKYRRGPNRAEDKLIQLAQEVEVGVTRRGYPDFAVVKDREIIGFIEVKRHSGTGLKDSQDMFRQLCEDKGIPFAVWDPDQPLPNFVKRG